MKLLGVSGFKLAALAFRLKTSRLLFVPRLLGLIVVLMLAIAPAAGAAYPVHTKTSKVRSCSTTEKRSMQDRGQFSGSVRLQCRWKHSEQIVRHNGSNRWNRICSWDTARGYFKGLGWLPWSSIMGIMGRPSCSIAYAP